MAHDDSEASSQDIKSQFLLAVDQLGEDGKISSNAQVLLRDLTNDRDDSFFHAVVYSLSQAKAPGSFAIHHWDDILQTKIDSLLRTMYAACPYQEAADASAWDRSMGDRVDDDNFVYGEVEFESFLQILGHVLPTQGVFYDLGSGTGKAVYTARLLRDFERCVGVELLPGLHALARSVEAIYRDDLRDRLPQNHVEFVCEDLTMYDWSDGTAVFCHSTCFGKEVLQTIFDQGRMLAPGAYLITFKTSGVDTSGFRLIKTMQCEMTWGETDVFIFQRLRETDGDEVSVN